MQESLLTPDEFVRRAVGVPWQRWRSDWRACDCFGLIVLYHREVLGVELAPVHWGEDKLQSFSVVSERWPECGPEAGATCFMAWRNGAPTHCGILLSGARVLHSEGSADHPGSVRVTRLSMVRRMYGDLKFYRYAPC